MKISREMQWRNDGIAFALQYAKDHGIEELEREVKRRGAMPLMAKEICKELDKHANQIKDNCVDTIMAMSIFTLRDEFKFGHERLMRFKKAYTAKTENLCEGWYDWFELTDMLKEEVDIDLKLRNEEDFRKIKRTKE